MVDDLFDVTGDDSVVLRVHVQPGAGRTAVAGRHGDALKVRVAAPPQGGRANDACVTLLAESFGVAAASVSVTSGAGSRMKRFRVEGLEVAEFRRLLEQLVDRGNSRPGPAVRPSAH